MHREPLTGILLDERIELTLNELTQACSVSVEWVTELVGEGVLEPVGREPARWRFSGTNLTRARTAIRLQQDLQMNLAGVALALDLLEEIEKMREHIHRLEAP